MVVAKTLHPQVYCHQQEGQSKMSEDHFYGQQFKLQQLDKY